MKKILILLYFSFIPFTIFVDSYQEANFMKKIGLLEAISNFILIFYYILNRKSKFTKIDWFFIEALLFTLTGGLLLLFFDNEELLMFINTVGFLLTHFMYITIFRKEGVHLPPFSSTLKDYIIIPFTIIFSIALLIIVVPHISSKLLVISFVYSTQMSILCWMIYFRPVSQQSYVEGVFGGIFLVLSNFWLVINVALHSYPHMVFVYFTMYATSQFLITRSIFQNVNAVSNSPSDNPL